jgi:putative ABC transport system permease protein
MTALPFAWRSLVRQPARAALGILGVAAVGALLLDMLLLSDGLVTSMRDMLERTGFDIRVTSTGDLPQGGTRIPHASRAMADFAALPEVEHVMAIRFVDGTVELPAGGNAPADTSVADAADNDPTQGSLRANEAFVSIQAIGGEGRQPWTVLSGRDATGPMEVVVSRATTEQLQLAIGAAVPLRARCQSGSGALPATTVRVVGVVEFPLALGEHLIGSSMATLDTVCGGNTADEAEAILVRARGDVEQTAAALKRARPDLRPLTNDQVLVRVQRTGFTYFQQISAVLTTVTLGFAMLLITVLLTVSVNQRLGEIAALRALGFTRGRVVADVLCESALIVGLGGVLSLPLGLALAQLLDDILKAMPGIPGALHFFVFEPQALAWHAGLLTTTAVLAALYPMRLVARLPIAATLRSEVVS